MGHVPGEPEEVPHEHGAPFLKISNVTWPWARISLGFEERNDYDSPLGSVFRLDLQRTLQTKARKILVFSGTSHVPFHKIRVRRALYKHARPHFSRPPSAHATDEQFRTVFRTQVPGPALLPELHAGHLPCLAPFPLDALCWADFSLFSSRSGAILSGRPSLSPQM